jgi:hypothetical protein
LSELETNYSQDKDKLHLQKMAEEIHANKMFTSNKAFLSMFESKLGQKQSWREELQMKRRMKE